ncbi:2-hydroxyacid dehydrogenase [Billgrantia aerodenitrificans]|jgi:glyoxylate/hydroxypyruvate reductase A|uniref:Glyoxylate/hydroxypyruvate reductase A n=1 Tax=Billgrantia aerodenitrificans TaxID=2733483 RepID=A0ABS9AV83_9GAMM|nr:glyoxylate/hydroxypyruvate reductase A [Halomonas aerodenitrificans]MCE8025390.1 glyoxylate/hydroxypyruvate reductase A [Halomonas aerodenitrificans]
MSFIYNADPERGREWQRLFEQRAPDIAFRVWPDIGSEENVRYLGTWAPIEDLERFPNLEVIFSLGAGVDQFDLDSIPSHVPLVRMQEPGIVATMQEYVAMAVLTLHRNLIDYIDQQRTSTWQAWRVRPASQCRVGILGLGQLGGAVAQHLTGLGFACQGWSRTRRQQEGVACFAGDDELPSFLSTSQVLVCLLPLTDETRGILNAELFGQLPHGASLVNVGRGPHLVTADLLAALDSGQLSAAVLDVFDPEPPPSDHPVWSHPRILLTPHVASMTQPESAIERVLDNIARHREGREMVGIVDRRRGY